MIASRLCRLRACELALGGRWVIQIKVYITQRNAMYILLFNPSVAAQVCNCLMAAWFISVVVQRGAELRSAEVVVLS